MTTKGPNSDWKIRSRILQYTVFEHIYNFRCVDEINQGMDDTNERQVWRLLAKTADESSSQFIYLAPKFPKNLEFDDSMLCHICYNGDVLKGDYDMPDLDKIIEAKRKQKSNKNKRRKIN